MKKLLKEYLTFSRKERNGAIVLTLLILTVIFYPQVQSLFVAEKPTDFSAFQKDIEEFEKQTQSLSANDSSDDTEQNQYHASNDNQISSVKEYHLFYFDPNKIGKTEWKQLGVNDRTTNIILKYTSKGGKFKTAEDLKKIYSFSEEDYNRLAPFVKIVTENKTMPSEKSTVNPQQVAYTPKTKSKIDINTADSALLETLNGIGPTLASRIVKFRNRIGGFFKPEQLMDVYGLKPETFDLIKDRIEISSPKIISLSVNNATADELKTNPYFSYKIINALISYRTQHGLYKTLDEIKNCELIDDALFNKVAPYLSL